MPLNEPGELIIKGPQVMKGYWNRPDENAKTLVDVFVAYMWYAYRVTLVPTAQGEVIVVDVVELMKLYRKVTLLG